MAHTYLCLLYHVVFSTKDRRPFIKPEIEASVWRYMVGIAKKNNFHIWEAGGMPDHIHLLMVLPSDMDLAKAVQLVKGGSSLWISRQHVPHFQWQKGFSAFTVSHSLMEKTKMYIRNQKSHHKKMGFEAEYRLLLERHGVKYDEKYLLG